MKGISRRLFVNTVGIVVIILVTFTILLSSMVKSYAYNSIQQVLKGRADELFNVLSSTSGGYKTPTEFSAASRQYIENFPDKNSMEIMAIDRFGKVFITSTGFDPDLNQVMPDYADALQSETNFGFKVFRLDSNEKVMAISKIVKDSDGNLLGSVRYMVSLQKSDKQIQMIVTSLVVVGFVIILVVFLSGLYFVRSIVVPVRQVTASASRIAKGDFSVRTEKKKDDEIGRLCDSINDMASELAASDKMKNDFISSVSHELRTPLTSIKGWAETLKSNDNKFEQERGMGVIIHESERLYGIVEELLDFSRLQSGRLALNLKKIDLFAELGEAVYMFSDLARTQNKKLIYNETDAAGIMLADANRLRQIFINVLDNALKYTDDDGVITVSSQEHEGWLIAKFSDNGCGIPKSHLPHIKKKFYKANQIVRGSGIGLAVADEIAGLHAGFLDIESKDGIGTTVTIKMPSLSLLEKNPTLYTNASSEIKNYFEAGDL